jgi:hypothetical protein
MSTDPSSSPNSQESPGNQEMPSWAVKLFEEFASQKQIIKQLSDKVANKPGPSENQQDAEGEPGKATEKTQEPVVSSPVDEATTKATADAKPPDPGRSRGKLDTATLNSFPEFGSDDLSYAEKWIADAEELAETLQLSKRLLCLAFCQRAVGDVKAYLEHFDGETKNDWSKLCGVLLDQFGREVLRPKHKLELLRMDKIAGMPLRSAVSRLQGLVAATDHPSTDLDPIWVLIRRFPPVVAQEAVPSKAQWKTCQEAFDDLARIAKMLAVQNPDAPVVATPTTKPTPEPKAGLVAVAEPVAPAETVLVAGPTDTAAPRFQARRPEPRRHGGFRCFGCQKTGHSWRQCPVVAEEVAKTMQSKK